MKFEACYCWDSIPHDMHHWFIALLWEILYCLSVFFILRCCTMRVYKTMDILVSSFIDYFFSNFLCVYLEHVNSKIFCCCFLATRCTWTLCSHTHACPYPATTLDDLLALFTLFIWCVKYQHTYFIVFCRHCHYGCLCYIVSWLLFASLLPFIYYIGSFKKFEQ